MHQAKLLLVHQKIISFDYDVSGNLSNKLPYKNVDLVPVRFENTGIYRNLII